MTLIDKFITLLFTLSLVFIILKIFSVVTLAWWMVLVPFSFITITVIAVVFTFIYFFNSPD